MVDHFTRMIDRLEWAWSAGFFDGEGSSYVGCNKPRKDGTSSRCFVRLRAAQKHREPLDRLKSALGGNVTGPDKQGMFAWQMQASKDVPRAMATLWPSLGSVKKQQYTDAQARADIHNKEGK